MEDHLPDIQRTKVSSIRLSRVGVSGVDFPIYIKTKEGKKVLCYAKVNLFVSLKHNIKGINMSRTVRTLMKYRYTSFSRWVLWKFLYDLKNRSDTEDAYAEINFKYFIDRVAPVSKEKSVMSYDCSFIGHINKHNEYTFNLRVSAIGTSLCPCSKSMSLVDSKKNIGKGAHNQRSIVTVTVETKRKRTMWIEDLVGVIEDCFSCRVYPVLKRPDEKYVTEKAYENPKFVEDIARDIATTLQSSGIVKRYKVKVVNKESIHTHDAVAYIYRKLKGKKWIEASRGLK
ncbi:MAG: GTP cyclohydrolase I FolE2 [Candidatus Asgardarchaeum californiense]|nr:MAG: GTP cyclohydrolase I FolE2 [Candidatus Asgardarchaeum californiense]